MVRLIYVMKNSLNYDFFDLCNCYDFFNHVNHINQKKIIVKTLPPTPLPMQLAAPPSTHRLSSDFL
jgi:hypothetical protein